MAKVKFPRTVYRKSANGKYSFSNKQIRDARYDSLIVENQNEYDMALSDAESMGYVDSFHEAVFGPMEEEGHDGESF